MIAAFAAGVGLLGAASYYLSRESAPPELSGVSPGTLSPERVPGTPQGGQPAVAENQVTIPAPGDPVAEFNRRAARIQRMTTAFVKIARVGEIPLELHFDVAKRGPMPRALDNGKTGGFFERLAPAARSGDDGAVRMLYTALKNCEPFPKTAEELRDAEGRVHDAFAKSGGVVLGQPVKLEDLLLNARNAYERCQGIVPAMGAEALTYLRASAERGDQDNTLIYAEAIAADMPDEARAIIEKAWNEHGRIAALNALAVSSLPHKIAAMAVQIAIFDGRPNEGDAMSIIDAARGELKTIENSTSPSTFRDATEEAARLLRNPTCCRL